MSKVIQIPTSAPSYFTVYKAGRFFDVVLVTPCPGKNLKTRLARFMDREAAIEHGKAIAARQLRPFKIRRGAHG